MAKAVTKRYARSFLIGVVVVALIAAVVYVATIAGSGVPGASSTTVRAAFAEVGTLSVGDDVRQNSKRIGRVDGVELSADRAIVTMRITGDYEVYRDARAAIAEQSALGQKFVELLPGSEAAGRLGNRTIAASRTAGPADLDEVLNVFDERTRNATSSTLREVGTGLAGRSRDLHDLLSNAPSLLADLGEVSSAAADSRTDLPALLRSADRLAGRFAGRQKELSTLLDSADQSMRALAVDNGAPLRSTLGKLPDTVRSTEKALDALDRPLTDTATALSELQPGADALAESTPDIRGVLREGVDPLRKVPGVAGKALPAVRDLTGTVADARPLAPKVTAALSDAETPLQVLMPYSREIGEFFANGKSTLSQEVNGNHFLRLALSVGSGAGHATGIVRDPLVHRNAYPDPGEATRDRAKTPLGGGTR